MRIGVDARLIYYQPAGIGLYTQRLLEALSRVDSENEYRVLQSRQARTPLVAAPHFSRRSLWTPPHHRLEQLALPLELAPLGLDLLHSPDFIPPFYWPGASVITVMDLAFLRFPYLLTAESKRYYGQIGRAVQRAEAILAISHSTKSDLITLLGAPPDKITVTHLAADAHCRPVTDPARLAAVRQTYGLEDYFILFLGTIEPRKDVPSLLRAYSGLREKMADCHLVVAGRKGWLYQEVFDLAQALNLGDAVRFIGGVAPDDLPALYSAARLFVLPSLYEGFGMPILEAMACGAPVVCTNTSSLPEIAGDAVLLVPPGDPSALAQAMQRALTDENLRRDLIQRGFRRAAGFSWDKTAQQTLAVYRSAAENHQKARKGTT